MADDPRYYKLDGTKLLLAHYWDGEHKSVTAADLKSRIVDLQAAIEKHPGVKAAMLGAWKAEIDWRKKQLAKLEGA